LLITDKNAVFVYARKLAYGSEYKTKVKCPECGEENDITFDLDLLSFSNFDFSNFTKGINEFEYKFPVSKRNIKFKLLKGLDEKLIREELKAISRFDKSGKTPEITTRLKKMILSVDGKEDKNYIKNFVDNLPSKDSLSFRKNISSVTPSLNLTFDFECTECGYKAELPLPIDVKFFWPEE
jgi:rRNA maturation protein Nop10